VFAVNEDLFATTLRQIVSAPQSDKKQQDGRIADYRRKIEETFFRGGKLVQLPSQKKKRLVVLDRFTRLFEPMRRYSESEVTELITTLYPDYCTIRRLLVDEGLILRDAGAYWRESDDELTLHSAVSLPIEENRAGKSSEGKIMSSQRAAIKQAYKQLEHEMGVYQLQNRNTGKIFISSSQNLESSRKGRLFELKTGKAVFNRELQKDLDAFGAESFEFSVLAVMDKPDPDANVKECLATMERHWMEKLQPYGDRGYHKPKK
jgi:hypothetical protein